MHVQVLFFHILMWMLLCSGFALLTPTSSFIIGQNVKVRNIRIT